MPTDIDLTIPGWGRRVLPPLLPAQRFRVMVGLSRSDAQWRERARWIRSYVSDWHSGPFDDFEKLYCAAEAWEREHRG